jgi:hypothetical protein
MDVHSSSRNTSLVHVNMVSVETPISLGINSVKANMHKPTSTHVLRLDIKSSIDLCTDAVTKGRPKSRKVWPNCKKAGDAKFAKSRRIMSHKLML